MGHYKDNKGRPLILDMDTSFYVNVDGIPIEKTWRDLGDLMTKEEIREIRKKHSKKEVVYIFRKLYSLYVNQYGKLSSKYANDKDKFDKELKSRKEQAISSAITQFNKDNKNKLHLIVSFDNLQGIGFNDEPFTMKSHSVFIEQETIGGIVIVGANTYNTEWFQELELENVEVRVLSDDRSLQVHSKDHKVFYDAEDILKKTQEDCRPFYLLGGEKTFQKLYPRVTDLWLNFVEAYISSNNQFFSEIDFCNWETVSCNKINDYPDDIFIGTIVHLEKIKNRTPRWKTNPNKKDYLKRKEKELLKLKRKEAK